MYIINGHDGGHISPNISLWYGYYVFIPIIEFLNLMRNRLNNVFLKARYFIRRMACWVIHPRNFTSDTDRSYIIIDHLFCDKNWAVLLPSANGVCVASYYIRSFVAPGCTSSTRMDSIVIT